MKLGKLKIKNFLSIKEAEIDFNDYNGLIQIKGDNVDERRSNGAGKSSIFEAVIFGLFGRTIRGLNEDELVRGESEGPLFVELCIGSLRIIRGRKPSILRVYQENKEETRNSVLETQKFIESELKINYKTFTYSSIFGQHNNVRFVGSTPDDKRSLIKNYLSLDEYFTLRDKAKNIRLDLKNRLKANDLRIEDVKKNLDDTNNKIIKILEQKGEIGITIPEISLEEIVKRENIKSNLIKDLASSRGKIGKLHQDLNRSGKKVCITCNQSLPLDKIESKEEIQEKINVVNDTIMATEIAIDMIDIPIASKDYQKVIELKGLQAQEENLKTFEKEFTEKIKLIEQEQKDYIKKYDIMKFWETAFSEEGIIKYIIRNILDYFNTKCNFYLGYLSNNSLIIEFNDSLDEKIVSYGIQKSYKALSGGEQRMIDLAVAFSLNNLAVLNGTINSDLLFLDEVGENLDFRGVKGLYKLLKELKKDKKIFIITHNRDLQELLEEHDSIKVIKKNGETIVRS
jgi:DNA repair exonuclease SbcCD ATPase subunit